MKTLVTVIALGLATAFSATAQDNMKVDKTSESVKQQKEDMSQKVKSHTEKMTKDLDLNADQSARLMDLNKGLYADMSSMKNESMKTEDMEAMKMKTVDKYDSSVKNILDEKQFEKYSSMKDQYMSNMQTTHMKNKPTEKSVKPSREMSK